MAISAIREFLRFEAAGGVLLVAGAALALVLANSPAGPAYAALLELPVAVQIGTLGFDKPLLVWINDGLMAIFFLLIGLEIKREIAEGELSSVKQAVLPVIAAIGGMVAPALVYSSLNWNDPTAMRGWAIPTATDIAFAVGMLTLLGRRVPVSLKVFLLALAIMDDLGAIVIIALFYTADLSAVSLVLAAAAMAVLFALNRSGVTRIAPYAVVGVLLWTFVLESGVHATLSGVALAFAIPLGVGAGSRSPSRRLEHALHPWVTYAILPIFAFANAGVSLFGVSPRDLLEPVPMGIALGLLIGKQTGVVGSIWLAVKLGVAALPEGARWPHIYGMAVLTGIGFTMSLFIGALAFEEPAHSVQVRLGVLTGSLLCAVLGYIFLYFTGTPAKPRK